MILPRQSIDRADVAHHYDELDWIYRDVWGEHVHHGLWRNGNESPEEAARLLVRQVAEYAGITSDSRVCDVGCGYGATSRMLHAAYRASVTGLTVSPEQHRYASDSTPNGGPEFLLEDWLSNSLPDATFDAVIAIESTEHMIDTELCFRQAFRVLRPGGRLVVCAWLAGDAVKPWEERWLLEPICREGRLPRMLDREELRAMIESSGFVVQRVEDLSDRVKRTWSICIRRTLLRIGTDRRYWSFLLSGDRSNREFALTLPRIRFAYATGAMRYVIVSARRP